MREMWIWGGAFGGGNVRGEKAEKVGCGRLWEWRDEVMREVWWAICWERCSSKGGMGFGWGILNAITEV